jgi:predicted HicB family RNase H-like nuclease
MTDRLLRYRGYVGSIECSVEDNCLYGEVLFVNDLINYEGKTVEDLGKAFEQAVDTYLSECEKAGLQPDRPFSGTFNVRLTQELHKQACIAAVDQGISLNELVSLAIQSMVSNRPTLVQETHHHTHVHTVELRSTEGLIEETTEPWQLSEKHRETRH